MEFRNCPFCGSMAVVVQYVSTNNKDTDRCFAKCEVCGAQTRGVAYDKTELISRQRAVFNAASAWNNRAGGER